MNEFPLNITAQTNFQSIPAWLSELAQLLIQNDFQAFLVGGAVRDLLWGEVPKDWDLVTDALPEQTETLFTEAGIQTFPTGKPFGTITVFAGGHAAEITTMRSDMGYSDGRRPDAVCFEKNIELDLARRDFTINAMAYNFATGMLVDVFQGRRDIHNRTLRAVGDPRQRFAEDGLRMFRYYRFLATLNVKPHRSTEKAICAEWALPLSMERIRDEFSKLLLGPRVRLGLNGLFHSSLFRCFLPELEECRAMDRSFPQTVKLWDHIISITETIKPALHLRLAALLHDIAKPKTRFVNETGVHFYGHDQQGAELAGIILERMRFPNKLIITVVNLVRWHMFHLPYEASDGAIRRFITKVGPQYIPDLLELRRADIVATGRMDYRTYEYWRDLEARIICLLQTSSKLRLQINGNDLMAELGLQPGPNIGILLHFLADLILDDPNLNHKELLLKKAKEYLADHPLQ